MQMDRKIKGKIIGPTHGQPKCLSLKSRNINAAP